MRLIQLRSLILALLVGLTLAPALAAAVIPESQLQRALRKQRRLLDQSPRDATLWNDLGNLLMLGGWTTDAEEAYKTGIEIDPGLTTARYNLALLYQQTDRPGRSKRVLHGILKDRPDHAWSRYFLGVAYAEGGQRKAAIREFALAIRLEPGLTDPAINPHVYDNDLLADAALRAYVDLQGAELAPRLYENRERVVRSMVRPRQLEATMSDPGDGEEVVATGESETAMKRFKPRPPKRDRKGKRRRDGN